MPPEEPPPPAAAEGAESGADRELVAIRAVVAALAPLNAEERGRVIAYVFARLGLATPTQSAPSGDLPPAPPHPASVPPRVTDIRSLGDQKKPRTAIEMVAVVAYYLSELAPIDERRTEITAADIDKYFKQANFPLP